MKSISFCAEEFCFNLKEDNQMTKYNFEEFLQDVLTLNPKSTPEMLTHFKMEDSLRAMFKVDKFSAIKDARSNRQKYMNMQENKVQNGLINRKNKIVDNKVLLEKQNGCQMQGVQDSIMEAYNHASEKRKLEFQKMYVKYVKLGRDLMSLHQQENLKLKDLEFKKLEKVKYAQYVDKKPDLSKERKVQGHTIPMEFQRRIWEEGKL